MGLAGATALRQRAARAAHRRRPRRLRQARLRGRLDGGDRRPRQGLQAHRLRALRRQGGLYAVIVDREMDYVVRRIVEAIATGSPRERVERRQPRVSHLRQGPPRRLRGPVAGLAAERDARPAVEPAQRSGRARRRRLRVVVQGGRLRRQGGADLRARARRHGHLRRQVVDRGRASRRSRRWPSTSARWPGWGCATCPSVRA